MDENQPPVANQSGENNPNPAPEFSTPPPLPTPSATTPPPPNVPYTPPPQLPPRPFNPPPPPPPLVSQKAPSSGGGKGRGWMILALILLVIVGLLVSSMVARKTVRGFTNSGGSSKSLRHKREYLEEVIVEDNNSRNKVLVIEINGVISSADSDRHEKNLVENIAEQLNFAKDDPNVRAVILKVNSPGGEVLASDEIYNSIKDFQSISHKPVIASMQTLAASGGYYVSAPCQWIVANDLTITGSIGVIMHGFNYRGLMDKIGLKPMTFKSGKFKDMLSGDKNLDTDDPKEQKEIAEEKAMVQELIMETYEKFTNIVVTGRSAAYAKNSKNHSVEDKGRPLESNWMNFVDGRVLSGKKAYDLGFVDELGNFETAKERAKTIASLPSANFVQYERPFDLGNLFKLFGKTDAAATTVKLDFGVNSPKLQVGQLYFIAPTSIPK
jgi:protease-4